MFCFAFLVHLKSQFDSLYFQYPAAFMPKCIQLSYCVHLSHSGTVCSRDGAHAESCTTLIIDLCGKQGIQEIYTKSAKP